MDHNIPYVLSSLADSYRACCSTASRKNFKSIDTFVAEPDSRAQCLAVEENVKEFGLTYFGLGDRRQGSFLRPRFLSSDR